MDLKKKVPGGTALMSVLLFVCIIAVLMAGTMDVSRTAGSEGAEATRAAIERAAVLCYASEGFYPPSLAYIQENYGVQVDTQRYVVRYDPRGANLTPFIFVSERAG